MSDHLHLPSDLPDPPGEDRDDEYEVGYRKPPKHSRFQPGRSGNPSGRSKGKMNLATVLARELAERVTITERGRTRTITKLEATVKQLVNSAATGNPRAMQLLMTLARAETAPTAAPRFSEADEQVKRALLNRLRMTPREDDDGPR